MILAYIIFALLLYPTATLAQRPSASPPRPIAGPAIQTLAWSGQIPPLAATVQLDGQCLVLSIPGDRVIRRAILAKTRSGIGYTVSGSKNIPTRSGFIRQFTIKEWTLATMASSWLDTLAGDFNPRRLSDTPCVETNHQPLSLSAADLRAISGSYLVTDTLLKITGPLRRPIGFKSTRISSRPSHELAGYDIGKDSVFIDGKNIPSISHLRYALLHEFGHRYDYLTPAGMSQYIPRPFKPSPATPNAGEYKADLVAHALAWLSLSKNVPAEWSYLYEYLFPGSVPLAARLSQSIRARK